MFNFKICFTYPLLLLLLIPAALWTFVPYFRIKKRYRRTRNRIVSLIMHSLVMVLTVAVLSGFHIKYYIPNENNEIILLVDVSDTENKSKESRDLFVQNVINGCGDDGFNLGVVTFGFNQVYAAPLTQEIETVFESYASAALPDTTATNLAAALEYTSKLFNHPETGKIVLVTDAKETDEDVRSTISAIAAKGITVDAAYVPSNFSETDVQVVGVTLPEQHIMMGEDYDIIVTLKSSSTGVATIALYDNERLNAAGSQLINLNEGLQSVVFTHAFGEEGMHELRVQLTVEDGLTENNEYSTYYNLEVFNKLLIVERTNGASDALVATLNKEEDKYEIQVVDISSKEMPKTLDELRMYDQVILNDIANSDLPEGFDKILESYVVEYGGGLFTAGGSDKNGKAHSYNKVDMYGSIYQELLPVQAVSYTPPIGVMIVIDSSGSMLGENDYGTSFFESAKVAALACLDVLYDRDYVGLMTLDTNQAVILELTPRTQETKIKDAIRKLESTGGNTVFGDAVHSAGMALRSLKNVAKRHIIVISDGMTEAPETYEPFIKDFYDKDGTTFSVVGINMEESARQAMLNAVAIGHGRLHEASNTSDIVNSVKDDVNVPKIQEVNQEPFAPQVYNNLSPLVKGLERDGVDKDRLTMQLGGFYGAKIKDNADLVLIGDYGVPIYAQWKYGAGMVGSFLCDLQGTEWSKAFMNDANGQTFLRKAVDNLMPVESVRPNDITVNITEDNYTNKMSVFAKLKDGERVKGELVKFTPNGEEVVSLNETLSELNEETFYTVNALTETNKYSRCTFVVKESGVYAIRLTKYNKDDVQVGTTLVVYKNFSYSEEYGQALVPEEEELKNLMQTVATKGGGQMIEDLQDIEPVFEGFVLELEKVFDPRLSFMIAAITFFLMDIAVCKFKFKWIHEIIRDRKRKEKLQ